MSEPLPEDPARKPSMARRFVDDVKNDWSKIAGHVRRAEKSE